MTGAELCEMWSRSFAEVKSGAGVAQRAVGAALRAEHPGARVVSAGMSGDLEDAIGCGATHVRVGSAVLGSRPRVE